MQVLINEHYTTIEMLIPFLDLYNSKKRFKDQLICPLD